MEASGLTPRQIVNQERTDYPLARLNAGAARVPHLCKVSLAGQWHMEDIDRAGSSGAILYERSKKPGVLHLDSPMVTLRTPGDRPHSERGGRAILCGNLAPNGAVVKVATVDPAMMQHVGHAKIYNSQEEARAGILNGAVGPGDVVVSRYEGLRGVPGMQEMPAPTANIMGTRSARIGHVSPEAAAGGSIAALQDGDTIHIDLLTRTLHVDLAPAPRMKRVDLAVRPDRSSFHRPL